MRRPGSRPGCPPVPLEAASLLWQWRSRQPRERRGQEVVPGPQQAQTGPGGSTRRPGVEGPRLAQLSKVGIGHSSSGEIESDPCPRAQPRHVCEPS